MTNPNSPQEEKKTQEQQRIDTLISRFAEALRDKLYASEEKYGWGGGWRRDGWRDELLRDIRIHVEKGDPRDVAAYCAFAWWHQWTLDQPSLQEKKASPAAVPSGEHECPVCYWMMKKVPSDYNICPRCGTAFGVCGDTTTYEELRKRWITGGCKFWYALEAPQEEKKAFYKRQRVVK